MLPLAILLLVHDRTGSLALAGLVVGAYGVGRAVLSPVAGALVDRRGQTRVLVAGTGAQTVLLAVFVVAALIGAPSVALIMLGAFAGAASPPVQACLRALWPSVVTREADGDAAYSFDATSQELIWISGPLLVALMLAVANPAAVVLVSAAVGCCGVAVFATTRASRGWRGARRNARIWPGALAGGNLRMLAVTSVLSGANWSAMTFGLTALAVGLGSKSASGALLAAVSAGSMVGGVINGSRAWPGSILARYRAALIATIACGLPLLAAGSIGLALPMSVLAGLPLAAAYASSYVLTGRLAQPGMATEAFTWTSSAFALGVALGYGLAGAVSQAVDVHLAFGVACLASAVAAIAAVLVKEPPPLQLRVRAASLGV